MKKENNEKKDFKPILIYFLITFGLAFVFGVALAIVEIALGKDSLATQFGYLGSVIPTLIVFIVFSIMYRKRIVSDCKKLKGKDLLIIFLIALGTIAINLVIGIVFEKIGVKMDNQNTIVSMFNEHKIIIALLACVFGPVIEEFVFRYSLGTLINNKYAFLIVSSLLFGIIHAIGVATILYVFLGAMFGLVYLKYNKNVVASIIIHALNNIASIIIMFLGL